MNIIVNQGVLNRQSIYFLKEKPVLSHSTEQNSNLGYLYIQARIT